MKHKILLATILTFSVQSLSWAEVAVIVHPSNTATISPEDIDRIFLGKKNTFSDNNKATPFYLAQGHAAYDEFNKKALGKSSSQIKAYWSKLIFTGKGTPPDAIGDVKAVIAKVASDPSAIAYIDATQVTDEVKVVAKY